MKKIEGKKSIIQQENGSITLFVLVSCLFFAFILTGTYLFTLNKLQSQEQNLKQIQENYSRNINRKDEIYQELMTGNILLSLTQEPTNDKWSQSVMLTGKAVSDNKIIQEYDIYKERK